jgi:hypothetical protein
MVGAGEVVRGEGLDADLSGELDVVEDVELVWVAAAHEHVAVTEEQPEEWYIRWCIVPARFCTSNRFLGALPCR